MVPRFMVFMRFWGYMGCNVNGLLVPILIYKITGSTSLAGIALLIEWLPKLFFYLYGGMWMAKIGSQRSHYIFDSTRVLAFSLLCLGWWQQMWILVAVAAALVQITNALSNILFEGLASKYALKGQVRIRQADLAAGLMMPVVTFLLPLESLLVWGIVIYLVSLLLIKYMRPYYRNVESRPVKISDGMAYIFSHKSLPWLIFSGLFISLTSSFIGSTFPFLIKELNPLWVAPFYIAVFNSVRFFSSVGLLEVFKNHKDNNNLPAVGIATFCVGLSIGLLAPGLWMLLGVLFIFYGIEIFRTWMRHARQELIPQEGRLSLTGIFSSMDALSYLVSALFLALSDFGIKASLAVIAVFGISMASICISIFFAKQKEGGAVWLPDSLVAKSK